MRKIMLKPLIKQEYYHGEFNNRGIIKNKKRRTKIHKKVKERKNSRLNEFLDDKIPENLQNILNTAFVKAFTIIFDKGIVVIEKTYDKEKIKNTFSVNEYAYSLNKDRRSLKKFSKEADLSKMINEVISGLSGIGMGALGIGIPDIAVFTSLILKSIYEMALHYGFSYDNDNEKKFILLLIQAALQDYNEFVVTNEKTDYFIQNSAFESYSEINEEIIATSNVLACQMLYMKFLQGIPVIGAVGGMYDYIFLNRINKYAQLKYKKRFLLNKQKQAVK